MEIRYEDVQSIQLMQQEDFSYDTEPLASRGVENIFSSSIAKLYMKDSTLCNIVAYLLHPRTVTSKHHDYATVDEAVFSPCGAELCCAAPRLLLSDNCKRLDCATVRRGHVTSAGSAVTSHTCNAVTTVEKAVVFCVSDQAFIGETEVRLQFLISSRREAAMGCS
jgi:hypothetical protein